MKHLFTIFIAMILVFPVMANFFNETGVETTGDISCDGDITCGDDLTITGDVLSINGVDYTWPAADGSASQILSTNGSGTLSWGSAGAATALDDIGDPDANTSIDCTTFTTTATGAVTGGHLWTFTNTGAFGDYGVVRILQETGNATDGKLLYLYLNDADVDFLDCDNAGTTKFLIDSSGNVDAEGTGNFAGLLTLQSGLTVSGGNVSIGDGTGTFAISTSNWDVSTAGVLSGLTGLSFSGDLDIDDGYSVKGTAVSAETYSLQIYDNDTGPGYKDAILFTNGNTPAIAIGDGNPTVAINSSTWDISTAGASTWPALLTANAGVTIATGQALTVGTTQWDDGSDAIDGEQIADDTIDDDAIDFTDVTGGDFTTLNDITVAVKTTLTIDVDGACNLGDTTADSDVAIGNSTGDVLVVSDDITLTLTDATDDVFQINGSGGAALLDIDLGAADAITLGDNSTTIAVNSSDWDISATGAITGAASVAYDSGTVIYYDTVALSNADIKALRASPKELVAAPAAGYFVEVVSATLIMDYGSDVLTESADNMVIEYATSGADITGAIEATGFIDQAVDQMALILPAGIATDAATDIVANAVQLFNTGDGEYGGNATADTTMTVKIAYRVHPSGL